jgi:phage terminase large subunit-like protein
LWREIDAALADWVDEGLVEPTDWLAAGYEPYLTTPLPHQRGVWFDRQAVERVLRFFLLLRHLVGRHNGHAFRLLDWQVRYLIAPVFGIKRDDGLRAVRTFWFEIPRKNGKSTLCSGLVLYLAFADREASALVVTAAASRDQADLVFNPARDMALGSPALTKRLGRRNIQRKVIEHPRTHSVLRSVSSAGDLQHGLNVHGGIVDEVHVHKNPDVIDAIETGTGARTQPLVGFITTADEGRSGSVYDSKRGDIELLAGGHDVDHTMWGCVFSVDDTVEGFDPFAEETLRAANPGYGVTVMADYLAGKAAEARRRPAALNRYLRLHLNVRTKQTARWFALDDWDASAREPGTELPRTVSLDELEGRSCFAGLDLAATTDLTSLSLLFPPRVDVDEPWVWVPFFWLPEDRVSDLVEQTKAPFDRWATAPGHLGPALRTVEGSVMDYRPIRSLITDQLAKRFRIMRMGYDRWNAIETASELAADGIAMEHVPQGYAGMTAPCRLLERLVLNHGINHGGHPVLRWNADCVEVKTDGEDHLKPVKPDRRAARQRIDGVASGLDALAVYLRYEEPDDEPATPSIRVIGG